MIEAIVCFSSRLESRRKICRYSIEIQLVVALVIYLVILRVPYRCPGAWAEKLLSLFFLALIVIRPSFSSPPHPAQDIITLYVRDCCSIRHLYIFQVFHLRPLSPTFLFPSGIQTLKQTLIPRFSTPRTSSQWSRRPSSTMT